MTVVMVMGRMMGMTSMEIALISGGMMTGDERRARILGMVVHLVVMGTVVFGLLYAARFHGTDPATWLAGQVIGLVHGLAVGVMAMPVMDAVHPRTSGTGGGFPAGRTGLHGWRVRAKARRWACWSATCSTA
ncbi:hypothetical protein N566_08350 [Streptomycetaceae bacterium MP113-05]|nr:hypothetical protein N566_08350 [Streptomycetaceae bacterium MP113-05]